MWGSIENLKENLNKIALDVHDEDDEELEIYNSPPAQNGTLVADRRTSNRFARSSPPSRSPLANGFDSPHKSEEEQDSAIVAHGTTARVGNIEVGASITSYSFVTERSKKSSSSGSKKSGTGKGKKSAFGSKN